MKKASVPMLIVVFTAGLISAQNLIDLSNNSTQIWLRRQFAYPPKADANWAKIIK